VTSEGVTLDCALKTNRNGKCNISLLTPYQNAEIHVPTTLSDVIGELL
jgi:hypothetical protein